MSIRKFIYVNVLILSLICSAQSVLALTLPLPKEGSVIGSVQKAESKSGETLSDVGRRYDVGLHEMNVANPGVSTAKRLRSGTSLIIPTQYILPNVPRKGMVINLAELRLYYYPKERNVVMTEPVGIGREGHWRTPVGLTSITKKEIDPHWRPTANVRAEAAKHGMPIPSVFPPGPDNPLGKYILRLGWPTYLIHGTNRPEGVGSRVSAGCIRMLPEDAKTLYNIVPVGTQVRVINEPYKAGWKGSDLYFEAHPPLEENKKQYASNKVAAVETIQAQTHGTNAMVRWKRVKKLTEAYSGMPEVVGAR